MLTGPCGAAPWRIESGAGEHPLDTVRRIVEGTIDGVLLVHSTSWRARGSSHAAPDVVGTRQVIEHGLRHLAWLAGEDPVVRTTLDDGWHAVLAGYVPEPFRQLQPTDGKEST